MDADTLNLDGRSKGSGASILCSGPVVVEWNMMDLPSGRFALIAYCMYFQRGNGWTREPALYNTVVMGLEPLGIDDKTKRLFNLDQAITHNDKHDDPDSLAE